MGRPSELNGRDLTVVGGFPFGPDFVSDGTLLVSDRTFLDLDPGPDLPVQPGRDRRPRPDPGRAGADPNEVRDRLRKELGASPSDADRDVEVLTVIGVPGS